MPQKDYQTALLALLADYAAITPTNFPNATKSSPTTKTAITN